MNVFDQYGPKVVVRTTGSPRPAYTEDYLCHFGTKGMKWGVRRYQDESGELTELGRQRYGVNGKRSNFGIGRDLNKVDREITRSQAKADAYRTKFERKRSKEEYKAAKRGTEVPEMTEREAKLQKKAEDYQKLADRGRQFTEKVIANSLKSGKSIYSKDIKREINIGKTALQELLVNGALVGTRSVHARRYYFAREEAIGKKYKVRDDGRNVRAHKKKYDPNMKTRNNLFV